MSDHITSDLIERQRTVSSAIVEKVLNDPAFRQRLVDAPEAALREAGLVDDLQGLTTDMQGEVSGYAQQIEAPGESQSCQCCVTVLY
jgi:hypothetical protein